MLRPIVLFLVATSLSACSTIDRGFNDHVRVDTVPQGATASFTFIPSDPNRRQPGAVNRMVCEETPCAFEIPRRQRGIVRLEKDGFSPVEYFVSPSRYRLGGGVNMDHVVQKTIPSSLAVGLAGGLRYAALSQSMGLGSFFGPFELLFQLPFLELNSNPVSLQTGATVGTSVGVGIAAGSFLIDMGTSANENTYPNPVVIGLASKDTPTNDDPFVAAYSDLMTIYKLKEIACRARNRRTEDGLTCHDAHLQFNKANAILSNLEAHRNARLAEIIKANETAEK